MKKLALIFLAGAMALSSCSSKHEPWKLVWTEDFNAAAIDDSTWTRVERGRSDWNDMMSLRSDLAFIENGELVLLGKVNDNPEADPTPFVTGGITSRDKKSFRLARFEIRARFNCAKGFWPALWLMPQGPMKGNDYAEIDIMEHLNHEDIAYQTVHSRYTLDGKEGPVKGNSTLIDPNDWNTYGVEVHQDSICLFINDTRTFAYPRMEGVEQQFPWPDYDMYMIISNQLGGKWVGPIEASELPSELRVDWIKVYERNEE